MERKSEIIRIFLKVCTLKRGSKPTDHLLRPELNLLQKSLMNNRSAFLTIEFISIRRKGEGT